jgi:hypothetical protein
MTHPAIDFMNAMRGEGFTFEFRATSTKSIVESKGCPTDPRHPFNRPDSEYVIPALDHRGEAK